MATLSNKNAVALLLHLNRTIEEYADATVKSIIEDRNFKLIYPPNNGLIEAEKSELGKLENNEHLKNALRKILADNAAGVIFDLLTILDGDCVPARYPEKWSGVKLIDEESNEVSEPFNDTLHDGFFQMYWEWKEVRGDKGWKLDTYDE